MKLPEPNSRSSSLTSPDNLKRSLKIGPALPFSFFHQDTTEIARQLLGKGLYTVSNKIPLLAEIVEVEAYLGELDPASHSYRGLTKRNWPMFEPGGTCYVYLSYGINYCMNVVTGEKGLAEAILLRAACPILGLEEIRKNRGGKKASDKDLLSGPGKLTQALGIDLRYNGLSFDRPDFKLVDLGRRLSKNEIGESSRIGISKAKELALRFFIKSSPWLSRKE